MEGGSPEKRALEKSAKFPETRAAERERGRSAALSFKRPRTFSHRVRIASLVVSSLPRAKKASHARAKNESAPLSAAATSKKTISEKERSSRSDPAVLRALHANGLWRFLFAAALETVRVRSSFLDAFVVHVPGDVQERLAALPGRRPQRGGCPFLGLSRLRAAFFVLFFEKHSLRREAHRLLLRRNPRVGCGGFDDGAFVRSRQMRSRERLSFVVSAVVFRIRSPEVLFFARGGPAE
jgi:hypothetical protein